MSSRINDLATVVAAHGSSRPLGPSWRFDRQQIDRAARRHRREARRASRRLLPGRNSTALVWFVLHEVAGLTEVRNYADSWEEWGDRTDTPVEK